MGEDSVAEVLGRRLPLYAYLERIWAGRRVLEIGREVGAAEFLKSLGAARVVTAEGATPAGERFDVVVVPEADAPLSRPDAIASWRALLADGGRLVVAAGNADRPGATSGVGYYELRDGVAAHLPSTQMLGVTPFAGFGLVEFEGTADGLRIDSRLVKETEAPATYVALAGAEPIAALGYALVQVPWLRAPAGGKSAGMELTRQLEDAAAQAESAMRVARAQGDEIEELRGRVRRSAEDRAGLDAENAKLRRALAEADETVLNLTRRTADEIAAMTERMAKALRESAEPGTRAAAAELVAARDDADRLRVKLAEMDARAAAAEQRLSEVGGRAREHQAALEDVEERLRLADSELGRARRDAARFESEARAAATNAQAALESRGALAARDERIARLEGEKQDLLWRLAELEDKLRQAIARAVLTGGRGEVEAAARPLVPAPEGVSTELAAERAARERVLEEFHRAAAAHVEEITKLKATIAEQAALVAELEDTVASGESRATSAGTEAATLRKTAKGLEEADRLRRSRLAELEGKLLRLEHERKAASASGDAGGDAERDRRLREIETERDQLRARLRELEASMRAPAAATPPPTNGHDQTPRTPVRTRETADLSDTMPDVVPDTMPDLGLLENRLGNYRERAARLRDDLEAIRRRLDGLSASEISGFLEELGEDLAELER